MRTSFWKMAAFCCSGLLVVGCGGEEQNDEERADLEQLEGKADIPSWIKHIPTEWGCDQTISGKFKGWDSAHMVSFPGKIGYQYTFSFKATYASSLGAVVAVYDSETGKRVAYQRNRWDNDASVVYTAAKSIKYLVAAYSVMPYATGSYTFAAACKVIAVTCQGDFACAKTEFCKFKLGVCGQNNQLGVCTVRPQFCTEQYSPVCGCDGKTYGNACFADGAGASVSAKGECKPVTQCEKDGGTCTHFLTKCKAGFVDGSPMDCPLGKSGKCCLPEPAKVTLTTDKKGYLKGQPIVAELANGMSESIFAGGCSVLSWEKQENGQWVSQGPDKVCFWEGFAVEVKAGAKLSETLSRDEGTFRLVAGYGIGCTPGKPLSQAACKSTGSVTSEAFKVKSCPMLSMPNPNAFCPKGKMEPKYDADGICISGYSCLPCEVKDCGPQMGMPNTLCPDGKTVSGPTGKCLASGWGTCAWEVLECPNP